MLILIGVVPTAYALNRAPPEGHADAFIAAAHDASKVVEAHGAGYNVIGDPRPAVTDYIHAHQISEGTYPSLAVLVKQISDSVAQYGSVAKTPLDKVENVRNDMYLASEALRVLSKDKESELSADEKKQIGAFKKQLDYSTKFIPLWVKVCVAIALGLGTMVGWKRIVVTVGEKIGKTHLTYGQGAAAETRRGRDDRRGRRPGPAGLDHARSLIRRRRHHGRQWLGNAMVDGAQHRDGLGPHPAGGDDPVRDLVLHLPPRLLTSRPSERPAQSEAVESKRGRRLPPFSRLSGRRLGQGKGGQPPCLSACLRPQRRGSWYAPLARPHQLPPYESTGRERTRGMRTPRAFRSSSVRCIIAVISASEKASCWSSIGRPRSSRMLANRKIDLRCPAARRRICAHNRSPTPRSARSAKDAEQPPHVLVEHRDVEFEVEADQRPRADETQEAPAAPPPWIRPPATSCSRSRCTLIASGLSLALGLTVASNRSLVRMRLPRILIAATATMSSLRG